MHSSSFPLPLRVTFSGAFKFYNAWAREIARIQRCPQQSDMALGLAALAIAEKAHRRPFASETASCQTEVVQRCFKDGSLSSLDTRAHHKSVDVQCFKVGSLSSLGTTSLDDVQAPISPTSAVEDDSLRRLMVTQVEVYPAHLNHPEVRCQPLATFQWHQGCRATGADPTGSQYNRYAVFSTADHAKVRPLPGSGSFDEIVFDLLAEYPGLRSIRLLKNRLGGFPAAQFVVAQRSDPLVMPLIPVDFRPLQGRVCTVAFQANSGQRQACDRCTAQCPQNRLPPGPFSLQLPDGERLHEVTPALPDFLSALHEAEEDDESAMLTKTCTPSLRDGRRLKDPREPVNRLRDQSLKQAPHGLTQSKVALPRRPVLTPPGSSSARPPQAPLRPTEIAFIRAARATVFPPDLDGPALYFPLERIILELRPQIDPQGRGRYTVFEPGARPRVRACGADWVLGDFAADAAGSALFPVRSIQFITRPLHGHPIPQVVLSPTTAPALHYAVVFDLRSQGSDVVTACIPPALQLGELEPFVAAGAPIPALLRFRQGPPQALIDSADRQHGSITPPLAKFEWVILQFGLQEQELPVTIAVDETEAVRLRDPGLTMRQANTSQIPESRREAVLPGDPPPSAHPRRMANPAAKPTCECLPEDLFAIEQSVAETLQFPIVQLTGRNGAPCFPFTVLSWHQDPKRLTAGMSWSLHQLAVVAQAAAWDDVIRAIHVVQSPLPGLASPQLVLTPANVTAPWRVLPIDLRPIGGSVFPVPVEPEMHIQDIFESILPFTTTDVAVQLRLQGESAPFLQDQLGAVLTSLPASIEHLEWIAVRTRGGHPSCGAGGCGTTSTTTLMRLREDERLSFTLVHGPKVLRTSPQLATAARPEQALALLVGTYARQTRLPDTGTIHMLHAFPLREEGNFMVPFVLARGLEDTIAVIIDTTLNGRGMYSIEAPVGTWAEQLLTQAQKEQELTFLCNGMPLHAVRRPLEMGDYLQLVHINTLGQPSVTPATYLMHCVQSLRLWSLPVAFPPLAHVKGPLGTELAERNNRAFIRFFQELANRRLDIFGRFEHGCNSLWLLSARHPPFQFAIASPYRPTLEEAQEVFRASGIFTPQDRVIEAERAISISGTAFVRFRDDDQFVTALMPAPLQPEFFHTAAIANSAPPPLHLLPRSQYTTAFAPFPLSQGVAYSLMDHTARTPLSRCASLQCGVTADMFDFVFAPFGRGVFDLDWLQITDMPQCSGDFVKTLSRADPTRPLEALQMYVDGSFFPDQGKGARAGWAIIALGLQGSRWCWVGICAVDAPIQGSPHTLGTAVRSCFEAELSAIGFALAVAIAHPIPVMIGYDSTSAGDLAQGFATAELQTALSDAIVSMSHLLDALGRRPHYLHIHSHQQHPLNELADKAAKAAACQCITSSLPTSLADAAAEGGELVDETKPTKGQLGCQIWFSKKIPIGKLRGEIAVLSLPKPPAGERTAWWADLHHTFSMIPCNCVPIVLLDANARLACAEGMPSDNASMLRSFLRRHELSHSDCLDAKDKEIETWISPNGQGSCIDYVLFPETLRECSKSLGPVVGFEGLVEHDHRPIAVEFCMQQRVSKAATETRLNFQHLRTPQGRQDLQRMLCSLPAIPWDAGVDEHLASINSHIKRGLSLICPKLARGARRPITTDGTWLAIQHRRELRRDVHRQRLLVRLSWMRDCFQSWRRGRREVSYETHLQGMHLGLLSLQIGATNRQISRLAKHDAAEASRQIFQDAKTQGPDSLFRMFRGVMKAGRKYKRPNLVPALIQDDGVVASDSQAILGQHFASAERAIPAKATEILTQPAKVEIVLLQAVDAISLPRLAHAFGAMVRGFLTELHSRQRSGGVVFVDGQTAFYATIRQGLTGQDARSTLTFLNDLATALFDDEPSRDRFIASATAPGLLARCDVQLEVRRLIAASLDQTWFSMGFHGEDAFITRTGTTPGAPLADLTFQYVFSTVLERLKARFAEIGCVATVGNHQDIQVPAPTWMDDLAIPFTTEKADEVVPTAALALGEVATALREAGIAINWGCGKSELLPIFYGPGAKTARTKWCATEGATFPVTLPDGSITSAHITPAYVHLGSLADMKGGDIEDIRRRRLLARELLRPLMRLLCNPFLDAKEKTELLLSMPVARFKHGAGLWRLSKKKEREAFHAGYMELLRRSFRPITGCSSRGLTDEDICDGLGVLSSAELRTVEVCRHAAWLWADESESIRALWLLEGEWLDEAKEATRRCARSSLSSTDAWDALLSRPIAAKAWIRSYIKDRHWNLQDSRDGSSANSNPLGIPIRLTSARYAANLFALPRPLHRMPARCTEIEPKLADLPEGADVRYVALSFGALAGWLSTCESPLHVCKCSMPPMLLSQKSYRNDFTSHGHQRRLHRDPNLSGPLSAPNAGKSPSAALQLASAGQFCQALHVVSPPRICLPLSGTLLR
ncbi:unnamed protein product [Symbiodinium sp. CCMP2592]|nr:unnamed protein product [Symbiodinium sp. CCMP2592]